VDILVGRAAVANTMLAAWTAGVEPKLTIAA